MEKLNLPEYDFKIKDDGGKKYIFDNLRKKYLILTPEEWVRQNIIRFLVEEKGFPTGLISVEAGINVNSLKRRYDALIYSRIGKPFVLVECKAPSVKLTQKVFEQILAYNSKIAAPNLLITNGISHYFLSHNPSGKFQFINDIPTFDLLSS